MFMSSCLDLRWMQQSPLMLCRIGKEHLVLILVVECIRMRLVGHRVRRIFVADVTLWSYRLVVIIIMLELICFCAALIFVIWLLRMTTSWMLIFLRKAVFVLRVRWVSVRSVILGPRQLLLGKHRLVSTLLADVMGYRLVTWLALISLVVIFVYLVILRVHVSLLI